MAVTTAAATTAVIMVTGTERGLSGFTMQKTILSLAALASAISFSGCVGSGPHTEAGAVTGAGVGALAGAIIGNNSHGGDALGGAVLGGVVGGLAGAAIGNSVDHEQGTVYGQQPSVMANPDSHAYRVARVQTAVPPPPPTPVDTPPPAPAPNAVWAPGYWIYDGRAYTWVGGHWEIPPPGARTYIAAHSENRGGQMVFVPGYWQ
jgi:hypothetical protein